LITFLSPDVMVSIDLSILSVITGYDVRFMVGSVGLHFFIP